VARRGDCDDARVTAGDDLALAGDVLVLVGLLVTWVVYRKARDDAAQRDREAALGSLLGVWATMTESTSPAGTPPSDREHGAPTPWGELYFGGGYTEESARARAQQDYDAISKRSYAQVFEVPTEPLAALVASPFAGTLIGNETIEAAQVALWQIGVFNQLVRQQTDLNSRHLAEIADPELPESRRHAVAQGAWWVSFMLHASAIGDARWYARLKGELAQNISLLRDA